MPICHTFSYLQENEQHFLKVRPFFIKDAKNHGNRLNHSCRKTRFKKITKTNINRFGSPYLLLDPFETTRFMLFTLISIRYVTFVHHKQYLQFLFSPARVYFVFQSVTYPLFTIIFCTLFNFYVTFVWLVLIQ